MLIFPISILGSKMAK